MQRNNFTSHTGSDGSSVGDRATAAGYAWSWIGENIAWGYGTVQQVVDGWMASPGHCGNIMKADYKHIGLACVRGTSSNTWPNYWTLDLGKPR